jgi:H+-translocating NAD(P) transhydrogenase subunit alpha
VAAGERAERAPAVMCVAAADASGNPVMDGKTFRKKMETVMLESTKIKYVSMPSRWQSARRRCGLLVLGLLLLCGTAPGIRSAAAQAPLAAERSLSADALDPEVEIILAEPPAAAPSAGWDRRETLLASLTIFVLAVFLGFELITKVPPTLHTPLMSGSNAISGITLVGALLAVGVTSRGWMIPLLGTLAVIMATVNAVGGFAVTHRMLAMFRRK